MFVNFMLFASLPIVLKTTNVFRRENMTEVFGSGYSFCFAFFGYCHALFWLICWMHGAPHRYGSIPINNIFSGMNIHLPAISMLTTGVQGFDPSPHDFCSFFFSKGQIEFHISSICKDGELARILTPSLLVTTSKFWNMFSYVELSHRIHVWYIC